MACARQRMPKQPVPTEAMGAEFLMSFPRETFLTGYHHSLLEELSIPCVAALEGFWKLVPGFSGLCFPCFTLR